MPSRKQTKKTKRPRALTPDKVESAVSALAERRNDAIPTYKGSGHIQHRAALARYNKGQPIPAVITREDASKGRSITDGWTNVISGLGHRNDKQHRTHFGRFSLILDVELQQMYMGDGLITRIVDCPAEDMTREWIDLEGDEEDEELAKAQMEAVSEVLEELDTEVAFNTALKWKRLYGGALIVMGILDGKTPDMPVDFNHVRGMSGLRVVDRVDVHIWNSIFDTDVMSPTFGQPLVYDVIFHIGVTRVEQFIHASRCIPLFGKRVPQNLAYLMNMEHRYWGLSEIQFVYDKVRELLLRPDVLLAGEGALAGRQAPQDELLGTQLDRLARRVEQADAERRRLADLYQAGVIGTSELRRRGSEVSARKAALQQEQAELSARHQELAGHNQLHKRLENFAARVASGFDNLDFEYRQRLMRLVIEQVRVTGWQVEVRLRIPLNDNPGDSPGGHPNKPENPSPKRQSPRPDRTSSKVSSELRLRSVHHKDLEALCGPGGLPLPSPALKTAHSGGPGSITVWHQRGCLQNDLPARRCEPQVPHRGWGIWLRRSLPASGSSLSCLRPSRRDTWPPIYHAQWQGQIRNTP